jgi:choline dehydrogenase-like flavoprotein
VVGSRQYAHDPSDGRHGHGAGLGNSVVNSYGQTQEIPNLYVAGPGIFATSGASNPTYTIFALSLRGTEQLAANWGALST